MIYFNENIKCDNIDEAWEYWWGKLTTNPEIDSSSKGNIVGEIINAVTVINNPTKCILKSDIRNMSMRYAIGELLWYLSSNKNLKAIQLITHNWDNLSDDGRTVNSNYGWCINEKFGYNQYEHIKDLLMINKNTRQAIIHIKGPNDDDKSKDVNCTICLQFFVRNHKLYLTTYMRSNDIWIGFPYDVFQFTCLQIKLAMEIGLELGSYTHIAGSLHLYEQDYDKVFN